LLASRIQIDLASEGIDTMTFKRTALVLALGSLWAFSTTSAQTSPSASNAIAAPTAPAPAQTPEKVSLAPVTAPNVPTPQLEPVVAPAVAPATPAKENEKVEKIEDALPANAIVVPIVNEPAPTTKSEVIIVAEPIVEVPPTDLWDRIRSGFTMSDLDDEYVRKWEQWYSSRPEYIARVTDRGSKYWFYIVTEIERRGMPLEIALLPVIESAFVTHANSSASAAGIWQFIPSTGKNFGMKQDWWADSRRDIVQATKGALDYLQKLHGMFGDWHLALASYNWGEGSVGRAVAANQAAGKPADYASLNMPAETRNYIPKLQAVKNIVMNPSAFNITLTSIPNQPYFKTISLAKHMDVDKAVKMAEISKEEFVALNPSHNRPVIGGREEHQILLPADKADLFISRLESGERALVSWMAYKTRAGDRLDQLASRFGMSLDTLRAVNGIRNAPPSLPAGYNLLVPSNGPSEEALGSLQNAVFTKLPEYAPQAALPKIHRVTNGETIATIAKRYGIAPQKLAQWNRMNAKGRVSKGTLLAVSGPMPMTTRLVKVKRGGKTMMVKQSVPAVRAVAMKGKGGKTKFVLAKSSGKKAKTRARRRSG
jgi:membrane-bound lytic murein transglycosylase D